jgi:hypothetical protein
MTTEPAFIDTTALLATILTHGYDIHADPDALNILNHCMSHSTAPSDTATEIVHHPASQIAGMSDMERFAHVRKFYHVWELVDTLIQLREDAMLPTDMVYIPISNRLAHRTSLHPPLILTCALQEDRGIVLSRCDTSTIPPDLKLSCLLVVRN